DDLPEVPGEGAAAAVWHGPRGGRGTRAVPQPRADRGAADQHDGPGLALVPAQAGGGRVGGDLGGTAAVRRDRRTAVRASPVGAALRRGRGPPDGGARPPR